MGPALVPRTPVPLTEPNPALLPSLNSMLELPAPQPPVMPLTHVDQAKPALVPRTPVPLMEPNPALLPSLKTSSPPVVSAPHQLKVLLHHAPPATNATVPRKPEAPLVPRPAKPYE